MYRLFLVDDEPGARKGLRNYFKWDRYGIEVVGEADDGDSAIELIQQVKPDIVLTDVKMPNMDGIQLAIKLREQFENIKIVFISGHDDVEYLKSALKVEAIDYILKPVNLKELEAVIEKVLNIIGSEERQKEVLNQMNIKLNQSMPLLRERFLISLIHDRITNLASVEKKMDFLGINLPTAGMLCVFVISVDDSAEVFDNITERDRQLTSFAIINTCQELIDMYTGGYAFENRPGEYVGILRLHPDDEEEKLFALANNIKDSLQEYLQLSVTIGVGKKVDQLGKLTESYTMAYEAASQKLFLGKNQTITMDCLETGTDNVYRFDMEKGQKLILSLRAADEKNMMKILDEVFDGLLNSRNSSSMYCHNICLNLILLASNLSIELDIFPEDERFKEKTLMENLFRLETVEDMKRFVTVYFQQICALIYEKRSRKSRNVIEQIKEIIAKRFSENLTVNDIANEVFLTSTYVCLIFKQETGETINEYLTKVRMENAKLLLKDYSFKLYDICYAVGYEYPNYFSKQFKKYTGLSPSEYREKSMDYRNIE